MFVEAQRNALIVASEAAYDVRPTSSTDEVIAAVCDRLMQRGRLRSKAKEWHKSRDTANQLVALTKQRFEKIASQLSQEIPGHGGQFSFSAAGGTVKTIPEVGYIPDFKEYNKAVWLQLFTERVDALGLSFHALGPVYRGFIGVIAYLSIGGAEPELIKDGTYQINYEEDLTSSKARFSVWLERVIFEGLNQWRRTL